MGNLIHKKHLRTRMNFWYPQSFLPPVLQLAETEGGSRREGDRGKEKRTEKGREREREQSFLYYCVNFVIFPLKTWKVFVKALMQNAEGKWPTAGCPPSKFTKNRRRSLGEILSSSLRPRKKGGGGPGGIPRAVTCS